jgi:uncharacterized protein (DUF433 family)
LEDEDMKDEDLLERIELNPKVMAGKPVIRGTRLPVEHILNLLAHGAKEIDILNEYDGLDTADIKACVDWPFKPNDSSTFLGPGTYERCLVDILLCFGRDYQLSGHSDFEPCV